MDSIACDQYVLTLPDVDGCVVGGIGCLIVVYDAIARRYREEAVDRVTLRDVTAQPEPVNARQVDPISCKTFDGEAG